MDDEIELLKPYIIFLEKKGYEVVEATNGQDAIDICQERDVDLIFLDENMPGLTGLETLSRIKELNASMPVVMVTKSEEENIMDLEETPPQESHRDGGDQQQLPAEFQ